MGRLTPIVLVCSLSVFYAVARPQRNNECTVCYAIFARQRLKGIGVYATVGKGDKEIKLEIEAGEQSITLTVKTDKDNLGDALYELELINDAAFFDTLNGIKADFNDGGMFWKVLKGDTMLDHGVNDEKISGGESYKFLMTNQW